MLGRLLGSDVTLDIEASPDPKWIVADQSRIEQVLLNLASTAATPCRRAAACASRRWCVDRPHEFVPGHHWRCPTSSCASPTRAQGMTPDVQARVFEPYFTTKERGKGTGLGLSTVYAIVSESGGSIRVASEPGRGTTFTIACRWPAAPEARRRREHDAPTPDSCSQRPSESSGRRTTAADGARRRRRATGAANRHQCAQARRLSACSAARMPRRR